MKVAAVIIVILLANLFVIHAIRAFVSARILNNDQFREFEDKGMMGTLLNDPTKFIWEYRFIASALRGSADPRSKKILLAWRICFGIFAGGIGAFLSWSLFLVFQGA